MYARPFVARHAASIASAAVRARTPRVARRLDESTWLEAARRLPADEVIAGTVTAGELVAFHERPPTPAGAVFVENVAYRSLPRDPSPVLHVYRRADAAERRPGVLFVHGGGWHDGPPDRHLPRGRFPGGGGGAPGGPPRPR